MNKELAVLLCILLSASPLAAQQAADEENAEEAVSLFTGSVGPVYNGVSLQGSARAAEYEYPRSSVGADLFVEYDPLPHRAEVELHELNRKDYFGEATYAFRDIVVVNLLSRSIYHNLGRLNAGTDDLATSSPSFSDRSPGNRYAVENVIRRVFVRFKVPDFPLHLFTEATTVDRSGTAQQMFLRAFSGGLDTVSASRAVEWSAREVRLGVNSHLGPLEAEYSHAEKKFEASGDKVLYEAYPAMTVPHNLQPTLESSQDTVRLHTAYTGRVVAAGAFSRGEKKNEDSGTRADFRNAAGDLTLIPVTGVTVVFKYRHYDLDVDNPATVALSAPNAVYTVRPSLSSKQDALSGTVGYRATERMTVKGEYAVQAIEREAASAGQLPLQTSPEPAGTAPGEWSVAHRTVKTTERLGISYRLMNRLSVRADALAAQVADPAYAADPDRIASATATVAWTPRERIFTMASYGGSRESRANLSAPLAGGSRKSAHDQALGSVMVLVGDRTSLTASYMYFKNRTEETLTFTDQAGLFLREDGVPYGDTAHVATLAASHALAEDVHATADASRCLSRGSFRLRGTTAGTEGIDELSDMKITEDIFTASLEWRWQGLVSGEFRFQHRRYDDKIDDREDGRVNTLLSTLQVKW